MANPGAILDAIETQESKEQQPHTDPDQVDQENHFQSREEVTGQVTLGEASGGSGWRAVMTNPITMEIIANFLSDKDLVSLCLTSKTTKNIVKQMDSSCWRKRAQKLEAVLRLEASDSTPYKERYILLIPEVERLANRIRGIIEDNSGLIDIDLDFQDHFAGREYLMRRNQNLMSLQELANVALWVELADFKKKVAPLIFAHFSPKNPCKISQGHL